MLSASPGATAAWTLALLSLVSVTAPAQVPLPAPPACSDLRLLHADVCNAVAAAQGELEAIGNAATSQAPAAARPILLSGPIKVWTSWNMGPDSGLDADLLDGASGEEYFAATEKEAAARVAGDEALSVRIDAAENVLAAESKVRAAADDALRARVEALEAAAVAWRPFPFAPGVGNLGPPGNWQVAGSFQEAQYRKVGDTVCLRGWLRALDAPMAGRQLGTLPDGFGPHARESFAVFGEGGPYRVDVVPSGVVFVETSAGGSSLSLSGICFSTSA